MTSTQIQCFLEAAKYENFTEAARVLFVTQPALSRQIALLEEEAGVVRFERKNNKIRLTAAGRELRARLLPLCGEYRQAIEAARMAAAGTSGQLTIGVQEDLLLAPAVESALAGMLRECPELKLELETHDHKSLQSGFYAGELELLYLILPKEEDLLDRSVHMLAVEEYPAYLALRSDIPAPQESIGGEALCALAQQTPLLLLSPDTVLFPGANESSAGVVYAEPYVQLRKRFVSSVGTLEFYLREGYGMTIVTPGNRLASIDGIRLLRVESDEQFRLGLMWRDDCTNPVLHQLLDRLEK